MATKRPRTDILLARHWLTHPGEAAYSAAAHMGIERRTIQDAADRLRERVGTDEPSLIRFLRENPIPQRKMITFRHPAPKRWLRETPIHHLLSGEDAAVIDGWDLVPHRHMAYIDLDDVQRAVDEILDTGGRVADAEDANLTLRVGDEWLYEEPKRFVERGQRIIDYLSSKNVQFLLQLRNRLPGVEL
ncbi:MAG: hypothetical protein WDA16_01750 [Candidatus Thermoplasmatota archaeon]